MYLNNVLASFSTLDHECAARQSALAPDQARPALRFVMRMAGALPLILLVVSIAGAIPLADYRARVSQAALALDSLQSWDEDADETVHAARIASTLSAVRAALPPTETVEWNGVSQRVDNSWLDEALKNYERLLPSDPQSADELARITERLQALSERLAEAEGSSSAATRKDEEKARLNVILRRPEYSDRASQGSAFWRRWEQFKKWLRDLFPRSEPLAPGKYSWLSQIAQLVVIALALALIAFAIRKLAPWLRGQRAGFKLGKRGARVILGERLSPDQSASDLLAEAETLARAGDLRAAIRKGYIALLCGLGERKVLSLAQHKTNRDYLGAVRDRARLHSEMQQLTAIFENHWYGLAPTTETEWLSFRSGYERVMSDE